MNYLPGEIIQERYRIDSILGRGGYGAVYRAWDLNSGNEVAIKESLEVNESTQNQFRVEAELLSKLVHKNLPRVSNYFTINHQGQYLVMDFIDGQNAENLLISAGRPLSEELVVNWITQVCDALIFLHNQKPPIIHRDIKPSNIRITPEGHVILVDFGISKVYDPESSTLTGARAVTPGYSPPEQFGLAKTDAKSDVYALAASAYHLLTGKLPATSMDILAGTVEPNPPAHKLNPNISLAISTVIQQAMEPSRKIRLGDAGKFKEALLEGSKS